MARAAAAAGGWSGSAAHQSEVFRINQGWQGRQGRLATPDRTALAGCDQGTKALAVYDELRGVLDALNRRIAIAEADEERRADELTLTLERGTPPYVP